MIDFDDRIGNGLIMRFGIIRIVCNFYLFIYLFKVFSTFSVNGLKNLSLMFQCAGRGQYQMKVSENQDGCESCYKHLCCWFCLKTCTYNVYHKENYVFCSLDLVKIVSEILKSSIVLSYCNVGYVTGDQSIKQRQYY